ncbi:MAG: chemotaxis protein [Novosphingobium sp. 12-62-10]|nr:MAG: chemotaxis protein [Novosphingobium sp. 12-62-10]
MISDKTRIGARIVIVAFLVGVALATAVVFFIRHGGPISKRTALQDELVADVLPPPAFVVESYLHAAVILHDPARVEGQVAELKEEHAEFLQRKAYWLAAPLPDALREPVNGTLATAEHFWSVMDSKFLPAVQARDHAAMSSIFESELTTAYEEQHEQVARVVALSKDIRARDDSADLTRVLVAMGFLGAMALAAIGVILWLTRVLGRMVLQPMAETADAMERMAHGDYAVKVSGAGRNDEIGAMVQSIEVFRENGIARLQAAADQEVVVVALSSGLSKLAEKDLEFRIKSPFPAEYEELRRNYNAAVDSLAEAMRTVRVGAASVQGSIGEIRAAADDLAMRNEEQAASLASTAGAMNAVTKGVQETAAGALAVQQSIAGTHSEATAGGEVVRSAVEAMAAIEKSALEIGQIIAVIDGIAFQTNLLALNAGVEAARAGEAGRGFAVVATEVRALAQRSAKAAQDIKTLITTSGAQVVAGVELVGRTGDQLGGIVSRIAEINGLIGGIAASASRQATNLAQVNMAVGEMDRMTQQNAAMVEETSAAAHCLTSEAERLTDLVASFRTRDSSNRPAHVADMARLRRHSALQDATPPVRMALAS